MKEIKSTEIVFNRQQIRNFFWLFIGAFLIFFEFYHYEEDKELDLLVLGIPLAVINFALILLLPVYYRFNETNLMIRYGFGGKEIIYYKDIKEITVDYFITKSGFFTIKSYEIFYPHKEKFPFNSSIHKAKKTKRLLEFYTNLEIE